MQRLSAVRALPVLRPASAAMPLAPANPRRRSKQAAQSGRQISEADRANASPATKAAIAGKERADARKVRSADLFAYIQQRSDKGRSGGRSGRYRNSLWRP